MLQYPLQAVSPLLQLSQQFIANPRCTPLSPPIRRPRDTEPVRDHWSKKGVAPLTVVSASQLPTQILDTQVMSVTSAPMDDKVASASSHGTFSGSSMGSLAEVEQAGKPRRKRISASQLEILLALFAETDTPSYEVRESVGRQLGMSNREVQVWFQNRRAKERTARQRQQQERPPLPTQAPKLSPSPDPPLQSTSSPPPPRAMSLPHPAFYARRRSLSTGNLDFVKSGPTRSITDIAEEAEAEPLERQLEFESGFGPLRPRLVRFHSSGVHTMNSRSDSPRDAAWFERHAATNRQLPSCVVDPLSSPHTQQPFSQAYKPPQRTGDLTRQASGDSQTLADRRNFRLPPVRILLDMVDRAAAEADGSPPEITSPQSCPAITPFERLRLYSPHARTSEGDVTGTSYFDTVAHGRAPQTRPYTFGRTFPLAPSPEMPGREG